MAVFLLAEILIRVWRDGGVASGADGMLVVDQAQYLSWLRQTATYGAAGNPFDLAPGPRSFVHPGLELSALLYRLGAGVALAYLAWTPVAVATVFAGARTFVRRLVVRRDDRRLALALALFTCIPTAAIVGWAGLGGASTKFRFELIVAELWAGSYLWGYLFTAVAVGLVPLGLLAYERGGRWLIGAAICGLLSAWLQPWQGATFAAVLVAAQLLTRPFAWKAAVWRAAPVLVATGLPLAYYLVLSRADASWRLAGQANQAQAYGGRFWPVVLVTLLPLAVPAALAYRGVSRDFASLALRAWPLAGIAIYAAPIGTFPYHALQGLTLPLAVLAVLGVRRCLGARPLPIAAAASVAVVLIVPGTVYRMKEGHQRIAEARQSHILAPGERSALRALERDPRSGGVLAPSFLAPVVPAYTGRETWVAAGSWTPDFLRRRTQADKLFSGGLAPAAARAVVRRSGARFVLADCRSSAALGRVLAGVTGPMRRFGCATVWPVTG